MCCFADAEPGRSLCSALLAHPPSASMIAGSTPVAGRAPNPERVIRRRGGPIHPFQKNELPAPQHDPGGVPSPVCLPHASAPACPSYRTMTLLHNTTLMLHTQSQSCCRCICICCNMHSVTDVAAYIDARRMLQTLLSYIQSYTLMLHIVLPMLLHTHCYS